MSKNSDKSSKDCEMVTIEASALVATAAGPREWSDNRKSWLARAARRLGFTYSRTRSIYYGEARIIRAEEWIRLNEEADSLKRSAQQRQEALHDLDTLARSAVAARREDTRPLGVASDEPVRAGSGSRRPTA